MTASIPTLEEIKQMIFQLPIQEQISFSAIATLK